MQNVLQDVTYSPPVWESGTNATMGLKGASTILKRIFAGELPWKPLEDASVFSPELSEIEIRDIVEASAEVDSGRARTFSNVENALDWLHSSQ